MVTVSCLKRESEKGYPRSGSKRKCSRDNYEFPPHRLPRIFSGDQAREIIQGSLPEQSIRDNSLRTGSGRRRMPGTFTIIRIRLANDYPGSSPKPLKGMNRTADVFP